MGFIQDAYRSSAVHRHRGHSQQNGGPSSHIASSPPPSLLSAKTPQADASGASKEDFIGKAFSYDGKLWLRASASMQVKELWRECEKRLKVHGMLSGASRNEHARSQLPCISH